MKDSDGTKSDPRFPISTLKSVHNYLDHQVDLPNLRKLYIDPINKTVSQP